MSNSERKAVAIRMLQTLADLIRDQHGAGDVQIRIERTYKKEMEQ
jgi:hypothetical protein